MAVVRILIDGYSFLHSCPEIAPGEPRHSSAAREQLISWLRQYGDATRTPITVVFDGAGAPPGTPKVASPPEMEVLYSGAGQTADQMIERAAHRLAEYGEVMVVTDDFAERDTIISLGGMAASCGHFLQLIKSALKEFESELQQYNRREAGRFKEGRKS